MGLEEDDFRTQKDQAQVSHSKGRGESISLPDIRGAGSNQLIVFIARNSFIQLDAHRAGSVFPEIIAGSKSPAT